MKGYICGPKVYEYKGMRIELSYIGGPVACNKKGEPYLRYPRNVAELLDEFWKLSEEQQNTYRTGGGCQRFGHD